LFKKRQAIFVVKNFYNKNSLSFFKQTCMFKKAGGLPGRAAAWC
jgi:hypothetical protein